jgi:hypothetical protein
MMALRSKTAFWFLLLIAAGCGDRGHHGLTSQNPKPLEFEIHDFVLEPWSNEQLLDDTGKRLATSAYRGRGTLLTRSPGLQNRTVLVALRRTSKGTWGTPPSSFSQFCVVKNGRGALETPPIEGAWSVAPPAPQYHWEVLGYAEMNPASLEQ